MSSCDGAVLCRSKDKRPRFLFHTLYCQEFKMVNIKKKDILIINTALGAVINKKFINKECTFPATSVFKNNQKKKKMYGHSSQLSSQTKAALIVAFQQRGSFLPSPSPSGSLFTVPSLPTENTLHRENFRVNASVCKNCPINFVKTGVSGKTVLGSTLKIAQSQLSTLGWSGSSSPAGHRRLAFVPAPVRLL